MRVSFFVSLWSALFLFKPVLAIDNNMLLWILWVNLSNIFCHIPFLGSWLCGDDCSSSELCRDGGICHELISNDYYCECQAGWEGENCEMDTGGMKTCIDDSIFLRENTTELYEAYRDMVNWRGVVCNDDMSWNLCRVDGGDNPGDREVFLNKCSSNGGQPFHFGDSDDWSTFEASLVDCSHEDARFGLQFDDYVFCAAPSCHAGLDIEMIAKSVASQVDLPVFLDLNDCKPDASNFLAVVVACQEKFLPTGSVCNADEHSCTFYTDLPPSSSCSDICTQYSATCSHHYSSESICLGPENCNEIQSDGTCMCEF